MKAAFYTLGCKVNQYESQSIELELLRKGFQIVNSDDEADVYIVNSCTVTAESDRKTRQSVRHLRKLHPDAVIVLTGCMPQASPQMAESLVEADIVTGNRSNAIISELLDRFFRERQRIIHIVQHENHEKFSGPLITDFRERTRATVKIQDGCNRFCTYCIIPFARGRIRSKSIEDIKQEVAALEKKGFSEIVLVGINLSSYGMETGDKNICDAIEAVASFEGIKRIRLGSLEPDYMTPDITDRMKKCEKLCPQFHLSLQSGCDKTLKSMNRHYNTDEYEELCTRLRRSFPDTTLTTDIMVGFAGETQEDFIESVNYMKKIGFEKVHVFPYSQRMGTKAASFPNQIENKEKARRSHVMIEEAQKVRDSFLKEQIGRKVSVLFEEKLRDGSFQGYTANYTPVRVNCPAIPHGIVDVKITGVGADWCIGELI